MRVLVIIFFFVLAQTLPAQVFNGIGLFGSVTSSRHDYENLNNPETAINNVLIPPSHRSSEYVSWGVGFTSELFDFFGFRLQSELQYLNKGALEKHEQVGIKDSETRRSTNKYHYLGFNNFLKYRIESLNFTTSILLGARTELMTGKQTPAYEFVASNFKKFWISPDFGLGFEPYAMGKLKFITEIHYNPDFRKQYDKNNILANNRTWELRLGIMMRNKKSVDIDCNAPVYRGTY